jgi:hypothetical protein
MATIFGVDPQRVVECTTLERCGQLADDFRDRGLGPSIRLILNVVKELSGERPDDFMRYLPFVEQINSPGGLSPEKSGCGSHNHPFAMA